MSEREVYLGKLTVHLDQSAQRMGNAVKRQLRQVCKANVPNLAKVFVELRANLVREIQIGESFQFGMTLAK